jgi:hypothetical protein
MIVGKVHRIKKAFRRLMAQEPLPEGYRYLAGGIGVTIGKRLDGTRYLWYHGTSYKKLMEALAREYQENMLG